MPSGKMNDAQRAICARIKEIRKIVRMPQNEFAALFFLTRNQWAGIEYGWTPLKYGLASEILNRYGFSSNWLRTGHGSMSAVFLLPSAKELKVNESALFSEIFTSQIEGLYKQIDPDPQAKIALRYHLGHVNARNARKWFKHYVPDGHVEKLHAELAKFWESFCANLPAEDAKRRIRRDLWMKNYEAKIKVQHHERSSEQNISLLTHPATNDKTLFVNQWHRLKARIQKATENPGGKSMLAKFLGVDLTQLSKWLTDSPKSAREPGADYTLKMLQWVEAQERK